MLAVGRRLHICHHLVVDSISAGGDGTVQAAAAAYGIKVRKLEACFGNSRQNRVLAVIRLVDDLLKLVQFLRGMVNAQFEKLLVFLKNSNLCGSGAGIDDQHFHGVLLSSCILQKKISPNNLMNIFIIAG